MTEIFHRERERGWHAESEERRRNSGGRAGERKKKERRRGNGEDAEMPLLATEKERRAIGSKREK